MNLKKFEFTNKDLPFIKKDIIWRLVFTAIFSAIFIWQITAMSIQEVKGSISTGQLVSTIFVLLVSLLMAVLGLVYAIKDIRIFNAVKKYGSCVSSVDILFSLKKDGFIKMYKVVNYILAGVSLFILLCSVTYSILQLAYFSTISYYMPILLLFCVAGFNSVFHIHSEIKTMETVNEYHAYY